MFESLSYKSKQFFFVLIKLSIVVGAAYFIYNKLVNNRTLDFSVFVDFLSKNNVFSLKNVFFLLFLTVFNWFFEILKWKSLVSYVSNISFIRALEQSLGGLTASLFTPNRIGEYGAKVIYFQTGLRKKIMLLTLLGNMAQMTVTTILGIIGFLIFYLEYSPNISIYRIFLFLGILLVIVIISGRYILNNKVQIKGFPLSRIIDFLREIKSDLWLKIFSFSFLKYLCFSTQFYVLLLFFKIDISYLDAMSIITSMYLIASIIPVVFIFDVIVKGSVAVYLFSFAGVDELSVLCITTFMWILNFVIPSIFGSYFVLNFNLNPESE